MMKRLTRVWLVVLTLLVACAVGIVYWRNAVVSKRESDSLAVVRNALALGDFVAARSSLAGIADPALRSTKEREIRVSELKSALAIRDTGLLRRAIGADASSWMDPKLLEEATLELAREAVQTRDFETYKEFAVQWQGKSMIPGQWILLEADQLLARGLQQEALKMLQAATLSGREDALRHARLALLDAKQPWKAMAQLDEGLKADPMNAELLSFRAQIEEAAGRIEDARLDYVAAVLSERKNPLYRDMLANYYLRLGDLPSAAETWRDAADDTGLGIYALKSWFWSRVSGVRLSKAMPPCRQQGWNEFISTLAATPDEVFWTVELDAKLARVNGGNERPEVAWLHVLEAIRKQDLKSAKTQLERGFSRAAQGLWPNLSLCLLVQLSACEGQDPRLPLAGREWSPVSDSVHPFMLEFSKWAMRSHEGESNPRFEQWLARPAAIVGTLFASGWAGAALTVGHAANLVYDPAAPEWFDYGYAKSLLIRDDNAAARKWLESLPVRSPAANLLLGEVLLTSNALEQGLALLQTVAAGASPHASRASWTLALTELDRGKPAKAREIILAAPGLAQSVPGKEILARIALADGARNETSRIYQELGEQSADAMIFLSKEAFAAGDFSQARKWTGILARRFPEQPAFRQNLMRIDDAEKHKKP